MQRSGRCAVSLEIRRPGFVSLGGAACRYVLQHIATTHCNNTLQQRTAMTQTRCNTHESRRPAPLCITLQRTVTHMHAGALAISTDVWLRNELIDDEHSATHTATHTATHCNTLQHTATHRNTPQHTATHRNTPQYTAIYSNTHCNTHSNTHCKTHCNLHSNTHCNIHACRRARNCDQWVAHGQPHRQRTLCSTPQHTAIHRNTPQYTPQPTCMQACPQL